MGKPAKRIHFYERANEPKVTISVVLLQSERDELAMWAREGRVDVHLSALVCAERERDAVLEPRSLTTFCYRSTANASRLRCNG